MGLSIYMFIIEVMVFMKLQELKILPNREQISKSYYSLDAMLPNEKLCLIFSNDVWNIYYSERGQKNSIAEFNSEDDACEYFYQILKKIIVS